jgi:hypothetical protein
MSQSSPPQTNRLVLSNQTYNVVKHVAAIALPALSTLYYALAQIWHFQNTEEVMGTISAVNIFLGAVMGVSTLAYNNSGAKYAGSVVITDTGDKKVFSLDLDSHPDDIQDMKDVTFKVTPVNSTPPPQITPQNLSQPGV